MVTTNRARISFRSFLTIIVLALAAPEAGATIYNVGPGQPYPTIGSVPWESLNAGNTVNIYWQPTPYREKFVLSRVGTASAPITVHGVLGPGGERPVLDGNGATTRPQLAYYSQERGVIKIGGSTVPFADGLTVNPQYFIFDDLALAIAFVSGSHEPEKLATAGFFFLAMQKPAFEDFQLNHAQGPLNPKNQSDRPWWQDHIFVLHPRSMCQMLGTVPTSGTNPYRFSKAWRLLCLE